MIKGSKHAQKTRKKMSETRKGKKLSEETKKKISKAHLGKKHSEKIKKKIGKASKGRIPWCKGKILSEEHKQNISKAKTGVKLSEEHKAKIKTSSGGWKHTKETKTKLSETRIGKLNYNWKGGIAAEPYCDIWTDKEYKESIKERDNYICQNPFCLCDNNNLVLHHINYIKKDCKSYNLITLCHSSNVRANFNRWMWQEIYEQIVKRSI